MDILRFRFSYSVLQYFPIVLPFGVHATSDLDAKFSSQVMIIKSFRVLRPTGTPYPAPRPRIFYLTAHNKCCVYKCDPSRQHFGNILMAVFMCHLSYSPQKWDTRLDYRSLTACWCSKTVSTVAYHSHSISERKTSVSLGFQTRENR